jgi:hypothetical protein
MEFDLLLRGVDPSSGIDAVLDMGFSNGRLAAPDWEIRATVVVRDFGHAHAEGNH